MVSYSIRSCHTFLSLEILMMDAIINSKFLRKSSANNNFYLILQPTFQNPVTLPYYRKHPYEKGTILTVSYVNLALFMSVLIKIQIFCDFRLFRVNICRRIGRVATSIFRLEQKKRALLSCRIFRIFVTYNVIMWLISFKYCNVLIL